MLRFESGSLSGLSRGAIFNWLEISGMVVPIPFIIKETKRVELIKLHRQTAQKVEEYKN
jgi:hypothetical protein